MNKQFELFPGFFEESENEKKKREKEEEIKALKQRILRVNDDYKVEDFKLLLPELRIYDKRVKELYYLKAKAKTKEEETKIYNTILNPALNERDEYKEIAEIYWKYKMAMDMERTLKNKKENLRKQRTEGMWYLRKDKGSK